LGQGAEVVEQADTLVGMERPKYPFGREGPFTGFQLASGSGKVYWTYVPNPKQYLLHNCCADEILYGGAVFGGKSIGILAHNAAHCLTWGQDANTVLFRRTFDELEGSLIADQCSIFGHDEIGVYKDQKHQFVWNNGAVTWFRHLQDEDALKKHQSRQYTFIGFDELTHFEEGMYTYMFQRLRSPRNKKIHPQIVSGTNPAGPGHRWVYERFVKDKDPNTIYRFWMKGYRFGEYKFPGRYYHRIFIPAQATDNVAGLKNDPEYLGRLRLSQPEDIYAAYVQGIWTAFEGMAFPEWNKVLHVVEPFNVPKNWKVIRCFDWGYSSPFYVGWLAQNPDDRRIYLVDEWYGARIGPKGAMEGLKKSTEELRQGIVDQERGALAAGMYPKPWYGVADASIFNKTTEAESIGHRLNIPDTMFKGSQRDRRMRRQALHAVLRVNPDTGKTGFASFSKCKAFNESIPGLVVDPKDNELVDTQHNDHPFDAVGYGLTELLQAPARRDLEEERQILRRFARRRVPV